MVHHQGSSLHEDFLRDQYFPLFHPVALDDLKDPCPVFDGRIWHVFGSGGTVATETWGIYHATAPGLDGPWSEAPMISLGINDGSGVAAPGVIYDGGVFHMFIQTEFRFSGGRCEHAVSNNGFDWVVLPAALPSQPETDEEGIYDPHPAVVAGARYLVYSGMPKFAKIYHSQISISPAASRGVGSDRGSEPEKGADPGRWAQAEGKGTPTAPKRLKRKSGSRQN